MTRLKRGFGITTKPGLRAAATGRRRRALAATALWERVQVDSTPCDVMLARQDDRAVIGRPTTTFAIDVYSRAVLGFSVSLEAASTLTVATCLVHACLPKDDWLARRELSGVATVSTTAKAMPALPQETQL